MKTASKIFTVMISGFFCVMISGCTASLNTQSINSDCDSVFPSNDDCIKLQSEKDQTYYESWYRGYADDPDVLLGYVFPKTVVYEKDTVNILVGIESSGRISKVIMLPTNQNIPFDFLKQFEKKEIQSSFEIARNTEDILTVPSKIKPVRGKIEISQMISDSIKEAVVSANLIIVKN